MTDKKYIRGTRKPDPPQEERDAIRLQIQSEWSERERMRRLGGHLGEYEYKPEREKLEQKYLGDDDCE